MSALVLSIIAEIFSQCSKHFPNDVSAWEDSDADQFPFTAVSGASRRLWQLHVRSRHCTSHVRDGARAQWWVIKKGGVERDEV